MESGKGVDVEYGSGNFEKTGGGNNGRMSP